MQTGTAHAVSVRIPRQRDVIRKRPCFLPTSVNKWFSGPIKAQRAYLDIFSCHTDSIKASDEGLPGNLQKKLSRPSVVRQTNKCGLCTDRGFLPFRGGGKVTHGLCISL
jgi:hypothetical protein